MQLRIPANQIFAASDDCHKDRAVEALQVPAGYVLMNSLGQAT